MHPNTTRSNQMKTFYIIIVGDFVELVKQKAKTEKDAVLQVAQSLLNADDQDIIELGPLQGQGGPQLSLEVKFKIDGGIDCTIYAPLNQPK